jgi:hypothetical protein
LNLDFLQDFNIPELNELLNFSSTFFQNCVWLNPCETVAKYAILLVLAKIEVGVWNFAKAEAGYLFTFVFIV